MKGITVSDFINNLYSNCDMEFLYKNNRYMIESWVDRDEIYSIRMFEISANCPVLFSVCNKDRAICVNAFEGAKLFDGKTIFEIDDEITVEYS